MSSARLDLLGTKTAYVPPLEEAAKGFFSEYQPQNDTFNHEQNWLQVGIRPAWVLQARELTELQTILKNQLRLIVEGDEVVLSTSKDIANGGGLRNGWFNKDTVTVSYENTSNSEEIPQSAVNMYNEVYGTVQYVDSPFLPDNLGVGDWLRDGNVVNPHYKQDFANFRDFKRILFGAGEFYVHPQKGLQPYFLKNDDERYIDLYGWIGSDSKHCLSPNVRDGGAGEDGEPAGIYPPNEFHANGSGSTAAEPYPEGLLPNIILGQQPDVTYIIGLSFHETIIKPGGTDTNDRYLLDNAAGFNNHEAPGAYRIKFVIDSMNYIPVFTGSLCPYIIPFFKTLGGDALESASNFPFESDVIYPFSVPGLAPLGSPLEELSWLDARRKIYQLLEVGTKYPLLTFPNDGNPWDGKLVLTVAQEKILEFLKELGYQIKPEDDNQDVADENKRIVLYKYPTVSEYYDIFNTFGLRKTFVEPHGRLDDREKNRLKLNHNSVVWDYRLIDPKYFAEHIPQGGIIGNGLMDLYGNADYEGKFSFALGTNSAIARAGYGGHQPEEDYYWHHKHDPLYIPYVPALKVGERFYGDAPYFEEQLSQTVAEIKSLTFNALETSTNQNFIPILYNTSSMFLEVGGKDFIGAGAGKIFDPGEMRFIIPPSPKWDWWQEEYTWVYNNKVYYSYHGHTLPFDNTNNPPAGYFNREGPYSWQ